MKLLPFSNGSVSRKGPFLVGFLVLVYNFDTENRNDEIKTILVLGWFCYAIMWVDFMFHKVEQMENDCAFSACLLLKVFAFAVVK